MIRALLLTMTSTVQFLPAGEELPTPGRACEKNADSLASQKVTPPGADCLGTASGSFNASI